MKDTKKSKFETFPHKKGEVYLLRFIFIARAHAYMRVILYIYLILNLRDLGRGAVSLKNTFTVSEVLQND